MKAIVVFILILLFHALMMYPMFWMIRRSAESSMLQLVVTESLILGLIIFLTVIAKKMFHRSRASRVWDGTPLSSAESDSRKAVRRRIQRRKVMIYLAMFIILLPGMTDVTHSVIGYSGYHLKDSISQLIFSEGFMVVQGIMIIIAIPMMAYSIYSYCRLSKLI